MTDLCLGLRALTPTPLPRPEGSHLGWQAGERLEIQYSASAGPSPACGRGVGVRAAANRRSCISHPAFTPWATPHPEQQCPPPPIRRPIPPTPHRHAASAAGSSARSPRCCWPGSRWASTKSTNRCRPGSASPARCAPPAMSNC
ncbi:hypothetical protein [Lysobacter gummosus]|uniref:hypothetical protein n=1 Tax=Lysobacter gummosus TaxID=262324 RepID=UPI00362A3834